MSRTIPFRPPQHPSECCVNGFLFNRTQLNKCMKLYSMDEFREFEGLWENYCISECYFNETNINTAADGFANEKLAVKLLNSNPYLSPLDIATCVKEGRSSHIHHTSSVQGQLHISFNPHLSIPANKYVLPVVHNPDAELINDESTTMCRMSSQSLALCLEEKIHSNCPKEKLYKDANCTIQSVIDECRVSSDQLYGIEKIAITN